METMMIIMLNYDWIYSVNKCMSVYMVRKGCALHGYILTTHSSIEPKRQELGIWSNGSVESSLRTSATQLRDRTQTSPHPRVKFIRDRVCNQYGAVRARLYLRNCVDKHSVRNAMQVIACENDINLPARDNHEKFVYV